MNIVIEVYKTVLNFAVLNLMVISATGQHDTTFYLGAFIAISMGLLGYVMIEWKNNTLTLKSCLIQAGLSICLCYLAVLIWRDYGIKIKIEYYLFFCSLFSVFIFGLLEKVFKIGLRGYARLLIRRVLAEDHKPNEEENI